MTTTTFHCYPLTVPTVNQMSLAAHHSLSGDNRKYAEFKIRCDVDKYVDNEFVRETRELVNFYVQKFKCTPFETEDGVSIRIEMSGYASLPDMYPLHAKTEISLSLDSKVNSTEVTSPEPFTIRTRYL